MFLYIENKHSTFTEVIGAYFIQAVFYLNKTHDYQYLMKHPIVCCYCLVIVFSPCFFKEYYLIYPTFLIVEIIDVLDVVNVGR
jgi:hypothetical protein